MGNSSGSDTKLIGGDVTEQRGVELERDADRRGSPAISGNTFRLPAAVVFWAVISVLAIATIVLFSGILLPFVAGFVLAYLFHPVVCGLRRVGIPRGVAAFIVVLASIVAAAFFIALIAPPIFDQLSRLIEHLPIWYQRAQSYLAEHYGRYLQHLAGPQKPGEPTAVEQIRQHLAPWLMSQLQGLLKDSADIFNFLALLFLTPAITFFLLRDWDRMIASIQGFLPPRHAPAIGEIAKEIDSTIAGYLRGVFIVLLIVSLFYMVALGAIGLNYGLLIGLVAGLFSFVPYLGSTGGFLVAGGVALSQYWPDYKMIALVCGAFVFGQVMEGNVLTPLIVGDRVRLHPLWLLFALVASGYLLGFLGLLISVPLAAAIGVLARYAIRKYYESPLHNEGQP